MLRPETGSTILQKQVLDARDPITHAVRRLIKEHRSSLQVPPGGSPPPGTPGVQDQPERGDSDVLTPAKQPNIRRGVRASDVSLTTPPPPLYVPERGDSDLHLLTPAKQPNVHRGVRASDVSRLITRPPHDCHHLRDSFVQTFSLRSGLVSDMPTSIQM